MAALQQLEAEFERAMYEQVYLRIWRECGYRAERFRQMICPPRRGLKGKLYRGGLKTAKQLLWKESAGFQVLDEKNRLDLSVEALVTQPAWASLFTEAELRAALIRLEERKRAAVARSAAL